MENDESKRVLDKLDKVVDHLASIDVTLAKQEVSLDEHIRRTELAEEGIVALVEALKPVQQHVSQVDGALKLLGVLSVIAGLIAAILKISQSV